MPGSLAISMCHYSRPDYTRQCLARLAACRGVGDYPLVVHVDYAADPAVRDEVRALVEGIDFTVARPYFHDGRVGGNRNTVGAVTRALALAEFVVHVEDDILLAEDALEFFRHCAESYRRDERVFTATAYNRLAERPEKGLWHTLARREWFHPWGWGTWRDRWQQVEKLDSAKKTWDVIFNHELRGQRFEVYPVLARSQNIGLKSSIHTKFDEAWFREHHMLKHWAGDVFVPAGAFGESRTRP